MTQEEDGRIRRLYTMDNLPVPWRTDSDLGVSTAHIWAWNWNIK